MKGLQICIEKGYLTSCHDVSEGGIAVSLSEMAIGGNIGAIIDISKINENLREDFILFSESNTRWIVEIKNKYCVNFEKILKKFDIPFIKIGNTLGTKIIIKNNAKKIIKTDINLIREKWKTSISNLMG